MTRPPRVPVRSVLATAVLGTAFALAAQRAGADAPPDWSALASEDTVVVVTADEDNEPRDTTIWIVGVDGVDYIRTGNTTWGDNLVRDPELTLKTDAGAAYPLRVEFVSEEDLALRSRIEQAFRDKYGTSDWIISFFRGAAPKIMKLEPRQ